MPPGNQPQAAEEEQKQHRHSAAAQDATPVGLALPAFLGVGHVRLDPPTIEHALVNPVAYLEALLDHARDARETQHVDQRIRFVVDDRPSPQPAIQVEQPGEVHFTAEQPGAHEEQVVIALPCPVGQEQLLADAVHVCRPRHAGIVGDGHAHPLCQVGMPACPVEDASQQPAGLGFVAVQTFRQPDRLFLGEVA